MDTAELGKTREAIARRMGGNSKRKEEYWKKQITNITCIITCGYEKR